MAQQGYVFRKRGSWHLRYRDGVDVDGVIVRKQKCVKLATVTVTAARVILMIW
jgi:hypothetical protein